jgi:pterin-4a-carbinolamine dehydratase
MSRLNDEILHEALTHLAGWQGDQHGIERTLEISDAEHAELTERIKVVADAMRLRPILRRTDGRTSIEVDPIDGEILSTAQVALAARIEAAYHTISGTSVTLPEPSSRRFLRRRQH